MKLSYGVRKFIAIPAICCTALTGCAKQPESSLIAKKTTSAAFDKFVRLAKNPNIKEEGRTSLVKKICTLPETERFKAFKIIAEDTNTTNNTRKAMIEVIDCLPDTLQDKGFGLISNNPNIDDTLTHKLLKYLLRAPKK